MSYKIYPLASASGKAIPLDIISPIEHTVIDFTASALPSPEVFTSVDLEKHMLMLYSTEDVTISFDDTTPVSDVDAGQHFIPAYSWVPVYAPGTSISAIGSAAGKLHINILELWDSLVTDLQQGNV